jgi:CheY-like chemotaxis protein
MAVMTAKAACRAPVVLIVEDEVLLRELVVDFVEDAGIAVLAVGDAEQAVNLLEDRSDIAVLFTDVDWARKHGWSETG